MARRRAFNAGGELISKTIDSVLQGVSQQPPTVRSAGQCEAQENMYSDSANGASRRAPTEHVAALDGLAFDAVPFSLPAKKYKVHFRDRDESLQHLVLLEDGAIRVFRLRDGVEATVDATLPMTGVLTETSGPTYQDRTTQANEDTANDVTLLVSAHTDSGSWYCGADPFGEVLIEVGTAGEGTYTMGWEYWDGSAWSALTVTDGTTHYKTLGTNSVKFTPPADWTSSTQTGIEGFWIRAQYVSGTLTQQPFGTQMWIKTDSYLSLTGDSASAAFAVTSVADYSFIVNKETTVRMLGDTTAARINQFMIHWVEAGENSQRDWRHDLGALSGDDATWGLNTGVTNAAPGLMCDNLISDVYDGVNYPLWKEGTAPARNVVLVVQDDEETDGILDIFPPSYEFSDEVYAFVGLQTQRFSDLPNQGEDNFITEITGADGNEDNNYWVVFDAALNSWVETVAPSIPYRFNSVTMPHVLIQTVAGSGTDPDTFTFGPQTWANREKGDVDSAPEPSFVGKKLSDIFFHKNRLGVLADESVVLSEAGEFFNYWPTTVTTIIESDPIDAASTNNRVALLDHAVPFDHKLYMFSGHGALQNVLSGGDTLTAANAEVTEASAYPSSVDVKPVTSGKAIYFVVDRGVSSSLFEYTVEDNAPDAWNLSGHIPSYIPANVTSLSLSPKEDVLTLLSSDEPSTLYVNAYYYDSKGDKQQNSFSKWTFDDAYTILGQGWIGEVLYLAISRPDGLHLEKLNMATLVEGDLDYRTHLDSLVELTGAYTVEDNLTRWTMPYYIDPASYGDHEVVLTGASFEDTTGGSVLGKVMPLDYEAGTDVVLTAEGDWSDDSAHLGRVYTHTYEFTKPIITAPDESGRSKVSITQGRLQIARFKILCKTSAGFCAQVSSSEINPKEITVVEEAYTYNYPGKIINASTVDVLNPMPISEFSFDVAMESKHAKIEIIGSSHLPFTLVGAEWEGVYSVRSSRV